MKFKISKKIINDLKLKKEYAFDIVYLKYNRLVYSVIFEIVNDKELTKDLVQDTFIKMFDSVSSCSFDDENRFRAWLCTIAKSKAIDEVRKKDYNNELLSEEEVNMIMDNSNNEFSKKMALYFPNLTIDEVKLINLYYNCKMSYSEIALYLDSNKAHIYREIKRITDKIDG